MHYRKLVVAILTGVFWAIFVSTLAFAQEGITREDEARVVRIKQEIRRHREAMRVLANQLRQLGVKYGEDVGKRREEMGNRFEDWREEGADRLENLRERREERRDRMEDMREKKGERFKDMRERKGERREDMMERRSERRPEGMREGPRAPKTK